MEEKWKRIIEFLLQRSTVLGIIGIVSVIWKTRVPEVEIEAILQIAVIIFGGFQLLKDSFTAESFLQWLLQDTTLRGLILAGCVLWNRVMPEATISAIMSTAVLLLGLLEILRDEEAKTLIFTKDVGIKK